MPLTRPPSSWTAGGRAAATALLVAGLAAAPAAAATIDVPADQPTIAAAVAAAAEGDVIRVAAGTYFENGIAFGNKDLVLQGVSGAAVTIIDGGQANRVFNLTGALTRATVIEGFTIRNGRPASGGGGALRILNGSPTVRNNVIEDNFTPAGGGAGIQVRDGADPLIEGNTIRDNTTNLRGGGIEIEGATAEVRDNTFLRNQAVDDPAFSSGGAMRILSATSEVLIEDNRFEGNDSAFSGGAINAIASDVRLLRNTFLQNTSATGGGLHLESNTRSVTWTLRDNRIEGNVATGAGGGLNVFASDQAATVIVEDNDFLGNQCVNAGCSTGQEMACCQGGGIRASQGIGVETYTGNLIQGNEADTYGGALLLGVADKTVVFEANQVDANVAEFTYAGVACVGVDDCRIARNRFTGNGALTASWIGVAPGALYLKDTASATVENNFFSDNQGREAGALYALQTGGAMDVLIRSNTFADNTTATAARGTLYLRAAPAGGQTVTVVDNVLQGDVRGIYVRETPALDIRFNDFFGFSNGVYRDDSLDLTTVAMLDAQPFAANNLNVPPGLVAPGDVHLAAGSDLVDAGSCPDAPAVDIDGEPRPLGAGCEIGADEVDGESLIFRDGFESGDTGAWSVTVP